MKQLAVFASGSGSNARLLFQRFQNHPHIRVACLVCNKPEAGAVRMAQEYQIPVLLIDKADFQAPDALLAHFNELHIDAIALAGFLWLIPPALVAAFPNRIINLHPSLLPLHGGKGMYGTRVHEAVLQAGDKQTGISIHIVNEQFDKGAILKQVPCRVEETDTPQSLALRVQELEHAYFGKVIEQVLIGSVK